MLFRDNFKAKGEINLLGAKIGQNLEFEGAQLDDALGAEGAQIRGSLYLRNMKRLCDAKFIGAHVNGDVQLLGTTIDGVIDFSGARIDGELQTAQISVPHWTDKARLILRNARLGALAGRAETFPLKSKGASPPMDLAGLSYTRLGGFGAEKGGSLAKDSVRLLKTWLAAGHAKYDYTPGPYQTLANALVEAGQSREANEILHAMHRQEARCEPNLLRKAWLAASGMFIGFGYRNWYGANWFLLIVAIGAAYGLWLDGFNPVEFSWSAFDEVRRWVGFSFGNSIPLVTLDKAHDTFLAVQFSGGKPEDLSPGIAWAFYIQKVVGFIILSYLAAGVTGLATRRRD